MPNPLEMSAAAIADAVRSGRLSAAEAVEAHLARVRSLDGGLRAFVAVREASALADARAIDERRARGASLGRLAGVPVALKDNINVKGWETTCGSRILKGFRAPFDSTAAERLRREDAVLIGKTNLDEFAMGSSTENSAFFATANPWDPGRVPGGSSGGSAAAVASGMCPVALGSDTGGSVRQPAGFCGVAGLKPTYGLVSRYGLVAFASSLDQIGPLTRGVEDAALVLSVIGGHDPKDSTSSPRPAPDYGPALQEGVKGLRVGLPKEYFAAGLDPEVEAGVRGAVEALERLGASVREVSLPHTRHAVGAYYVIAPCEASSNLARFDGMRYGAAGTDGSTLSDAYESCRGKGFGPEVKRRIMLGTFALSAGYYDAYYGKAQRVRTLVRRDFDEAFKEVDVLATPTSPTPAFRLGEKSADPMAMYLSDIFTITANLAGTPGLSVPCGLTAGGLPVGLQLLADRFREDLLFRAAAALERERPFPPERRRPPRGRGPSIWGPSI
ncbi:MAG: Asp-tRNA(Asn)/Glu-tRNA(Gln) amidotransferase subunit GatA [Elusimicrobia bacterium]|nr:Asp-tRNA(Asn)/Glu-tRNA(Gln) amidotransferase subunit GatA [Elusimicrobiota bacterium]